MILRHEHAGDAARITEIQYAAFKNHPLRAPGAEPTEHLIVERLRAAGCLTLSLLAEDNGQAVAHIALSPARVGADTSGWFLLGPIGVLPQRQRQGMGSALMRETLRRMRAAGALDIVLVGDPGFYGRFGFAAVPGLAWPGVPGQYVLAARFSDRVPQGAIQAHEAFASGA
jgi:putative acetyltransferase